MNDQQLLRYSRQIMLPQIDITGQQQLLRSRVLIIGAGGLGCPVAMYLAAAGVGHITIFDDDAVDLSNLQRQIAHHTDDIGIDKVISTRQTIKNLNPEIEVRAEKKRLEGEELGNVVQQADLVLDCSDNFATRFAINRACVQHQTPLISGAAIRFEGQISVFNPVVNESPCYNCLYQDTGEDLQSCSTNGVIAPLTGIIGSMQAMEAMKLLLNIGQPLIGRVLIFDGLAMSWQEMKLKRNPNCPTCSKS